jgi:hypothetical protein
VAEDHEAAQQREAACARHQQGVQRGGSRPRFGVPVADEEERRDGRELPAHIEEQHVVGLHEADHRTGEQHEQPREAAEVACVGRKVMRRVQEDRDTDHGHDQRHRRS